MNFKIWPAVFLTTTVAMFGQDFPPLAHQQTTSIPGARFEIVQSPLAAKWSFRLDRFSGRVWQLVHTKDEGNTWEEMIFVGLPKPQVSTRARFQLFTSGLAARHTFLLDSDSGKTWVLFTAKARNEAGSQYEYSGWQPFTE